MGASVRYIALVISLRVFRRPGSQPPRCPLVGFPTLHLRHSAPDMATHVLSSASGQALLVPTPSYAQVHHLQPPVVQNAYYTSPFVISRQRAFSLLLIRKFFRYLVDFRRLRWQLTAPCPHVGVLSLSRGATPTACDTGRSRPRLGAAGLSAALISVSIGCVSHPSHWLRSRMLRINLLPVCSLPPRLRGWLVRHH